HGLGQLGCRSHKVLCPNPGIQSHPPAGRSWTVWTVDCKLFVVSSANLIKDNGAEPSALLLAVIQTLRPALKPRAAAGPDSRLHASLKLGIPRCVTYVRRRTD